jgi:hypothetical protein
MCDAHIRWVDKVLLLGYNRPSCRRRVDNQDVRVIAKQEKAGHRGGLATVTRAICRNFERLEE